MILRACTWLYLKAKAEPVAVSTAARALAVLAMVFAGVTVAQFFAIGAAVEALLFLVTRQHVTPWEPPT